MPPHVATLLVGGLALGLAQRTRDAASTVPLLAARHARLIADGGGGEGSCAGGGAALPELDDLFAAAGLPPQASYRGQAETAHAAGRPIEVTHHLVVCADAPAALAHALPLIRAALCGADGAPPRGADAAAARELLAPLRACALDDASGVAPQPRAALLACSAYEGCLRGCWRGYVPVLGQAEPAW